MASIFNALHIGYSGLNAAQVGINVTGHNIANAETEGYTRQRVVTQASRPSALTTGINGNGVSITEIARVFDHYVYDRYVSVSENKTNSDFKRNALETLSSYFPEIDGVGIKADLNRYFDLWQSFADNPDNEAMKIALAQQTQTLSQNIFQTREKVVSQQGTLDQQMVTLVDEVNKMAKEIAALNISINEMESNGANNANDLRDRRNLLEKSMSDLIGASSFEGVIETNTPVDPNIAIKSGNYSLHVGGFNIVDGGSYHPIGVTTPSDAGGFHDLYYERQDGVKIPFEQNIKGGKIGAILELRGTERNSLTGEAENGILHDTVKMLDSFASGLIENTNNIYAQSATDSMRSDKQPFDETVPLRNTALNINNGSFDLNVYDSSGNVVATRTITIDSATAFGDALTPGSIIGQMAAMQDDNKDSSGINDIDDLIHAEYNSGYFSLALESGLEAKGYSFSITDKGTNFAGALGMHRFFEGNDARTIGLEYKLAEDTSKISAAALPVAGDNQIATQMVDMQFRDLAFHLDSGQVTNDSIYGFYDSIVTSVGTKTNAEIIRNDSLQAQFNAITMEYESVSKVSLDEELTNLIRYQTSYGAAAKVISTVDQMMTTLLGIKQ